MRIGVLPLLLVFTAEAYGDVFASHSPSHPRAGVATTLKATADTSATVELWYETFTLTVVNGQLRQTTATPLQRVKTCAAPQPAGGCTFTVQNGFTDNSLVHFQAIAMQSNGTREIDEYSFAAGTFPLNRRPIPIRVSGPPVGRFNIVVIADTDLGTPIRDQLDAVVQRHLAHGTIKSHRRLFNFYYSAFTGNFEPSCHFTPPANIAELNAVADAVVYLHKKVQRDCSVGSNLSCEITGGRTLLHEFGHVLFGLADEYPPDSHASQQRCFPNVWNTKAVCTADPISTGQTCLRVTKIGGFFWHIDQTDVMSSGQTFGAACVRRVDWHYTSCEQHQDCFPDCP
jgi:hypothetical protein